MKPNTPKPKEKDGIFVKLPGFTIVGNSVSVVPEIGTFRGPSIGKESEKFKTTTPSLIPGPKGDPGEKGDKGDRGPRGERGPAGPRGESFSLPTPPGGGVWVLGSVGGVIKWIPTEDCTTE